MAQKGAIAYDALLEVRPYVIVNSMLLELDLCQNNAHESERNCTTFILMWTQCNIAYSADMVSDLFKNKLRRIRGCSCSTMKDVTTRRCMCSLLGLIRRSELLELI